MAEGRSRREQRWQQLGRYENLATHIAVAEQCFVNANAMIAEGMARLTRLKREIAEQTEYPYAREISK